MAFLRRATLVGSPGFTADWWLSRGLAQSIYDILVPRGPRSMCLLQNSQPASRFICICRRKAKHHVGYWMKTEAVCIWRYWLVFLDWRGEERAWCAIGLLHWGWPTPLSLWELKAEGLWWDWMKDLQHLRPHPFQTDLCVNKEPVINLGTFFFKKLRNRRTMQILTEACCISCLGFFHNALFSAHTVKFTYQSCKSGLQFAYTSLWSAVQVPKIWTHWKGEKWMIFQMSRRQHLGLD